jgi:adenylate kinase family enzyme
MTTANLPRLRAILLIGPSGSGKSPLGDWLDARGLCGRRCHHFDFGANLRAVASGAFVGGFTPDEISFIRSVLETGALLDNETFHLAVKILAAFTTQRRAAPDDLLILNGLPRHAGQAEVADRLLDIAALVNLECDAATVRERIRLNSGGDRAERSDDTDAMLDKKLAIFAERTRALVAHYRERGAAIVSARVGVATQPPEIVAQLEPAVSRLFQP